MIVGWLLFAPAILIGWLVVRVLFTAPGRSGWMDALLEISLGAGVGIGIVSIAFFGLLWANITGPVALLAVQVAMAACAVWLMVRHRQPKSEPPTRAASSPWIWLLRAAAVLTLLFVSLDAAKSIEANPHGGWDAFSIWNLKAKFLAGGSGTWRNALAPVAGGTLFGANHPGYPLLLPAAVASAWTIQGDTPSATPAALGVLFALATAAILCAGIARLRGEASGLIALVLLLASEGFASQVGAQSADIPIGLYILATLTLLALARERDWHRGTLILAGLCCGLAVWTKNEGVPFAILSLAAVAAVAWSGGRKAAGWLALGAAPAVAVVAAFKILLVTGVEGVFPKTLGEALTKATDVSRWMQIAASFVQSVWQMGIPWAHPLLLVAILALALGLAPRNRMREQVWLAVPIAGLLAADFVAYLITTADLTWHLGTSNLRLLVQVWPALLLVAFLLIEPPAFPEAPSKVQKPARGKAERKAGKGSRVMHSK